MSSANQYTVMGHDIRDVGKLFLAAWRDLLWGDDSPIRNALEEPVELVLTDGTVQSLQADRVWSTKQPEFRAYEVSDELVLSRTLELPHLTAEDLRAAIALEVSACSPFAAADTVVGCKVLPGMGAETAKVVLAIASRLAVERTLGQKNELPNVAAAELWAKSGDHWVVLEGFGETPRRQAYRRRLYRLAGWVAGSVALLIALLGALTLLDSQHLRQLQDAQQAVNEASRSAIVARDELANINATIAELNQLSGMLPSPDVELAVLTNLLPDSAYISQFSQDGTRIRITGRAQDAAGLQKVLTEHRRYAAVTAPQAIRQVGREGLEQFSLDLQLNQVSP